MTFIDGTPDYIHIPSAACRIAATFSSAKLIVVLRDPVMRALSHWNMIRIMEGEVSPVAVEDVTMGTIRHAVIELRQMRNI
jgi:hypothetical protein